MLIVVPCPRNLIEKAIPRPGDGAPTIRLHASGTQIDLTGDKVTDQLLDSMLAQAQAGKVRLIDNHKETFPLGWSYGGEITTTPEGTRELHVDFTLDKDHPLYPIVMKYIQAGWNPQCSIGLLDNGGKNRVVKYDNETGKQVGFLLDAPFDHLAFTPPGGAAYPAAGIDTYIAKSLTEAVKVLKSAVTKSDERNSAMMKPEDLHKAMKEAEGTRGARKEAFKAKQGDAMEMCKAASEHSAGLAQLAKDVGEMTNLSPADLQAYIAHLSAENTVMSEALADLQADTVAGGEEPGAETPAAAEPAGAPAEKKIPAPAESTGDPAKLPPADEATADPPHLPAADEVAKDGGLEAMKMAEAEAAEFKAYMGDKGARAKEAEALAKEAGSEGAMYKRFKATKASPPSTAGTIADRKPGTAEAVAAPIAPSSQATPVATAKDDVAAEAGGKIFKGLNATIEKQSALIETLTSRLTAVEKQANYAAAPLRFMPGEGVTDAQAAENAAGAFKGLDPMEKDIASRKSVQDGLRQAFMPFLKRHPNPGAKP